MILVSFSSAENALSNDVNKYNNFSSQGTENPPFRFLFATRYIQDGPEEIDSPHDFNETLTDTTRESF